MNIGGQQQTPFPHTPLPGNQDIQPITSVSELLDEGRAMHHCVASYIEKSTEGRGLTYRVLAPKRATLKIVRLPDGKLRIGQIKLAYNATPAENTSRRLSKWSDTISRTGQRRRI